MNIGRTTAVAHSQPIKRADTKPPSILDRNISHSNKEVSLNAMSFLLSEIIRYAHDQTTGIKNLEARVAEFGYQVGLRSFELVMWREKSVHRENRLLSLLMFINTTMWRYFFGKQADSLEKSTDNEGEYMIIDNKPSFIKHLAVPKEMSSFSPGAFIAGMVEAILVSSQFTSKVSSHSVPAAGNPHRTVILIKVDPNVLKQESSLGSK